MKRIMSLLLGLSLVLGTVSFAFAQDSSTSAGKKKGKKKGGGSSGTSSHNQSRSN